MSARSPPWLRSARAFVMRPPVPPMFKIPRGLVGAGARESLSVVDVELSLSQQYRGAHVGDVSNRVEPC